MDRDEEPAVKAPDDNTIGLKIQALLSLLSTGALLSLLSKSVHETIGHTEPSLNTYSTAIVSAAGRSNVKSKGDCFEHSKERKLPVRLAIEDNMLTKLAVANAKSQRLVFPAKHLCRYFLGFIQDERSMYKIKEWIGPVLFSSVLQRPEPWNT